MKNILLSVAMIAINIVQSCSAQKTASESPSQDMAVSQTASDTLKSGDPLFEVFNAYLGIKNALAKDDGITASESAKTLFKAVNKVPMDKLTPAQHTVWMKYYEKLSYNAEHIKGTRDDEHQREHFVSLSKNMYAVVKEFNTSTANVYYQYCPMANDGKGAYWLSEMEKINNPYFGKKMLSCGSTKETMAPKK
jgi:hypothetical protein